MPPSATLCEKSFNPSLESVEEESIIYDPDVFGMFKKVNMLIILTVLDLLWKKVTKPFELK